jgi:hypothetical protein
MSVDSQFILSKKVFMYTSMMTNSEIPFIPQAALLAANVVPLAGVLFCVDKLFYIVYKVCKLVPAHNLIQRV